MVEQKIFFCYDELTSERNFKKKTICAENISRNGGQTSERIFEEKIYLCSKYFSQR